MAQPTFPNAVQTVSQFPEPPVSLYFASERDGVTTPVPPAPPGAEESYEMFGRTYSTTDRLPSLPESGRPCLYDETKPVSEELRRLNHALLSLFSSLVATLSTPGGEPGDIVGRIEDIFINLHHLLNIMRPAQAVQDIRRLLSRQAESRRKAAQKLNEAITAADDLIANAAVALHDPPADPAVMKAEEDAILVIREQKERPLPESRFAGKLGWYKGGEATSRPGPCQAVTNSESSISDRTPHIIEIDESVLAEFARLTSE
jgi:MED7 protein